jgi:hypothetical protein
MLLDWLERWRTPCSRPARALGYLRELHGIRRRHRQWASAWQPHLERTKGILRAAAARCPAKRKAVLFGSGWLLDVPLDELAGTFREVVLVDVVHPLATRKSVRRFANVRLLDADVTGTVEGVWARAHDPALALPRGEPGLFCGDGEVDLAASINLLSQLPCVPERYLLAAGAHPPEAIDAYARAVVQAHLDYLRRLSGVVALVADVELRTVSAAGRVLERSSTLYGAALPWRGECWVWPLVPRRPAYPHHGVSLVVAGIPDVKQAPPATQAQTPDTA